MTHTPTHRRLTAPLTALLLALAASAQAAPAATPWNAAAGYAQGATTCQNQVLYQARWWNEGLDPSANQGVNGSGQVWAAVGTCAVDAAAAGDGIGLDDARKKDIAMQLVSSAENSTLDWRSQYSYIEDIKDGRGYTAGIIGFCSGTGDMLELVTAYTKTKPNNVLASYLPALKAVNGSASHKGLDPNFTSAWKTAAKDTVFQAAQNTERDTQYFNPSVKQGKTDGLRALGQFIYYDAAVMHGFDGFMAIRKKAMAKAKLPSKGGNETTYLNAFLNQRVIAMKAEEAHSDTSRVDTEQRVFLKAGNLDLKTPLRWKTYGDSYEIK